MPQDDPIKYAFTREGNAKSVDTARSARQDEERASRPATGLSHDDSKTMQGAYDKYVTGKAQDIASTMSKRMMPGGNTMISVNSMKGEALLGRNANVASKKAFKANRYARSASE